MNEKYEKVSSEIERIGIVPVIKLKKTENAGKLADALWEGGVPVAEVTFRAEGADMTIKAMKERRPEMLVGAGTVLSVDQVRQAVEAGAQFIVSPGINRAVVEYCMDNGIPVFPGCLTPTEIETAIGYGLKTIKFFPAEQFGGMETIKAYSAPYSQVKFMPTGGISLKNLSEYISSSAVAACGGSFMVKGDMLDGEKWVQVTEKCRQAVDIIEKSRR